MSLTVAHALNHQKDKLAELDTWHRVQLPKLLHDRDPAPFITHEELSKLMEWKLKKGKWCDFGCHGGSLCSLPSIGRLIEQCGDPLAGVLS